MSDATINLPIRITHPDSPANGRVKRYIYNGEPYFMGHDGVPHTMIGANGTNGVDGAQGPQGIQGAQGVQGPIGPTGPAGATQLIATDTMTSTITLPNSSSFSFIRNFQFTTPTSGRYVMTGIFSVKSHSSGNDFKLEWDFDAVTINPKSTEEYKDQSAAESMLRPIQYDFGNISAGVHDLDWYFAKESTGGTAQIKYISIFIWKVS